MEHFFCKEWREGNFLIYANKDDRRKHLDQMRAALESERGREAHNAAAVAALRGRIAAVEAYDQA